MEAILGLIVSLFINVLGGAAIVTLAQPPVPDSNVPREEQSIIREEQTEVAPPTNPAGEAQKTETPSAENR